MKKLYFMFFISSITLQAQTEYGLLFDSDLYPREEQEMTNGYYSISFNGDSFYLPPSQSYHPSSRQDFFYTTPDNLTKKIYFYSISTHRECDIHEETYIDLNSTSYNTSFNGCYASSNISLLHLTPKSSKANFCIDEIIEFDNGFNWQYSYDGQCWNKFPKQFQSFSSIAFKISELDGYDKKTTIHFQTGYKTQFTNIITYNIIPCSPKIESISDKNFTSCIYSKDGNLDIQFDRDLAKNESFLFNFYTTDNALIHNPPVSYDKNTRKYTFSGLAQGDYYLKYQTFIGEQQASINEKPYPIFTISPPSKFKFDIIETQPTCYKEQGIIKIQASGGTPPYYYSINNGATIPFENPLTSYQNINKPDGIYSIKVTDNKGCIEK